MKTSSIAPVIVMREIARLLAVFARPKYWPATDEEVARRWTEVFDGLAEEQLVAAVTQFIRGDHSFIPKPGQLRAIAQKLPRYSAGGSTADDFQQWWDRGFRDPSGALAPCPLCGRAWQWHPRLTLVHDHAKHRELKVPCLMACDNPKCIGIYGVPQKCAPTAESAGELWIAPAIVVPATGPLELPPRQTDEELERAAIQEES